MTAIPAYQPHGGRRLAFDLDPGYSVLDDFEVVKGHVVGNVTRICGPCARKIQAELRFDDGISN